MLNQDQETIGSLIITWIKHRYQCNRLKDRLFFYVLLSLLINLYVVINAYRNNAILLWPALLVWLLMSGISTYFVYRHIAMNIADNIFKESQIGLKKRIFIIAISFLVLFLLQKIKIPDIYYYSFLAIPITLSFFVSTVVLLIWLIRYETKKGKVLIMKKKVLKGKS